MLPSTKKFLIKTHEALDELGYRTSKNVDFSLIKEFAIITLNHTKTLEDSLNVSRMYRFIFKNAVKINTLIYKHYSFWSSLPFNGNELIELVNDEDAYGTYFISNAFESKYKKIYATSQNFGDTLFIESSYKNGKFAFDDTDPVYSLRYSKMSSSKMVLLDKNDEKLCVIYADDNFNVFLQNNKTEYDILETEYGIGIFFKDYLAQVNGNNPDPEKMVGCLAFDIIEKKSDLGLSRLTIFNEKADLDMLALISASVFLIYKSKMDAMKSHQLALTAMSAWAIRR